jgi:CheY-like chemotaxis protein
MHALIIEDEPLIALMIEDQLRGLGYTSVDFAVTEQEAIAAARRRCPNLVTSDVCLAAGSGITAVAEICNGRSIPVVFITATGSDVREHVRNPIVVEKPFGRADLERAVAATRAVSITHPGSQNPHST